MYDLYIGNKNYSSWSLRPWVLMRELDIPFREILVPFGGSQNPDAFRGFSPSGKVPLPRGLDGTTGVGLAGHHRVRRREASRVSAAGRDGTRLGAQRRRRRCTRLPGPAQHLRMNCGLRIRLHAVERPLERDLRRWKRCWADGLAASGPVPRGRAAFSAVDAFFAPWRCESRPTIRLSAPRPAPTPPRLRDCLP
jgi:glutathione S-transferase